MAGVRIPLSPEARRRTAGIVLALAIELLIALLLLTLGAFPKQAVQIEQQLSTFNVAPEAKKNSAAKPRQSATNHAVPKPPPPAATAPPPPVRAAHPVTAVPGLIMINPDEYAKSDIGKMPAQPAEGDAGADSGTAYGPGEGPGGQPLYNAEWYREPSRAEMATYLPPNLRSGEAIVMCQTIEHYHVENCRSLGETPVGSGLGRAVRQAAWQFLIRPPRRGGKTLVGAWVRIRYTIVPVDANGDPLDK